MCSSLSFCFACTNAPLRPASPDDIPNGRNTTVPRQAFFIERTRIQGTVECIIAPDAQDFKYFRFDRLRGSPGFDAGAAKAYTVRVERASPRTPQSQRGQRNEALAAGPPPLAAARPDKRKDLCGDSR